MGDDEELTLRETVGGLISGDVQWNIGQQKHELVQEPPDQRTRVTTETTTVETTEDWHDPKR
jgi:hypothetical protein